MAGFGDLTTEREPTSSSPAWKRAVSYAPGLLVASVSLLLLAYRGQLDLLSMIVVAAAAAASFLLFRTSAEPHTRSPSGRDQSANSENLLSNIPDAVMLVDARIVVRDANRAASELLPALKRGEPLSFALRAPDVLDGIAQALKSGQTRTVAYRPRIPSERAFEVHIGVLKPDESRGSDELGALLLFRELTSAVRLEKMRVDFVANASHELRTPLASLLGFIETLQGPARDDPAARERFLEIMRGQALRMSRLIEDLLSLSRIELRTHVPPNTVVDLLTLARQLTDSMGPLVQERGVELSLHADDSAYSILGDRDELTRVIENLVDNAVKYAESGKRVDVSLARTGSKNGRPPSIVLQVRDYGPGIAPEHLPRLTERFYRVDIAESRHKGGTGLGLALVKHIVVRHRGRLHIESEPGKGALFRISFPEAPVNSALNTPAAAVIGLS